MEGLVNSYVEKRQVCVCKHGLHGVYACALQFIHLTSFYVGALAVIASLGTRLPESYY